MDLEKKLYEALRQTYIKAKAKGYKATAFANMLVELGPVQTAKSCIWKEGGTEGFARLFELHALDLSIEAVVLRDEFKDLFTDEDRRISRERLGAHGYKL